MAGENRTEGESMLRAGSVEAQRLEMGGNAIALVGGESVVRVLVVELLHDAVSGHLGEDGGTGYRITYRITFDHW